MREYTGRITKKIGKAYPDIFHGIKVTTVTKFPSKVEELLRRLAEARSITK